MDIHRQDNERKDNNERYRQWLRNKYKTLDALNQEWYETNASWDNVYPQRTSGTGTYAMDLDWNEFIAQKGAEDMRLQYATIRAVDKTHRITSHASPPSIFGWQLDDFLEAEIALVYNPSTLRSPRSKWRSGR